MTIAFTKLNHSFLRTTNWLEQKWACFKHLPKENEPEDYKKISQLFAKYTVYLKDENESKKINILTIKKELKKLASKNLDFFNRDQKEYPLHYAIMSGDEQLALSLVDTIPDWNQLYNGCSPLLLAIRSKMPRVAITILHHRKHNLFLKKEKGNSYLCEAVCYGQKEIAHAILKLHSKLNKIGDFLVAPDKEGFYPYHTAIKQGDLQLTKLLEKYPIHCTRPPHNLSFLHLAVSSQCLEMVQYFLNSAPDINTVACKGESPLHAAAALFDESSEAIAILQILLRNGADINQLDDEGGISPFFLAVYRENKAALQCFIHSGQEITQKTHTTTLLHLIVQDMETNHMLEYILNWNSAEINTRDAAGKTPLHVAIELGKTFAIPLLIQHGADINLLTTNGKTPFYLTIRSGRVDVLDFILTIQNCSEWINVLDENGKSPLIHAIDAGSPSMVALLIVHGAEIFSKSSRNTPLSFAFWRNFEIFKLLILNQNTAYDSILSGNLKLLEKKGAAIPPPRGLSLLHLAVASQKLEMVIHFLQGEHDVNTQADQMNGMTPLHMAVLLCQSDEGMQIIQALLDKGADANKLYYQAGGSPFHDAIDLNKTAVAQTIIHAYAERKLDQALCLQVSSELIKTTVLHRVVRNNQSDKILEFLLQQDASLINHLDDEGYSPLHLAKSLSTLALLIKYGADINQKTKSGSTVFERAILSMPATAIPFILKKGFNIKEIADPSQVIVLALQTNKLEMLNYILKMGVFPIVPLSFAIHHCRPALVNCLILHGAARSDEAFTAAFIRGDLDIIKLLMPGKMDPSLTINGLTPICMAAKAKHLNLVKYLVDLGYDYNSASANGMTPLHYAANNDTFDLFVWLHQKGAKLTTNLEGMDPMECAFSSNQRNIIVYKQRIVEEVNNVIAQRNALQAKVAATIRENSPKTKELAYEIARAEVRLSHLKAQKAEIISEISPETSVIEKEKKLVKDAFEKHLLKNLLIGNPFPKVSMSGVDATIECKDPILNEILSNIFKAFGKDFYSNDDFLIIKNISRSKLKTLENKINGEQLKNVYTVQIEKEKRAHQQVISHLGTIPNLQVSGSYPEVRISCQNSDIRNKFLIPILKAIFKDNFTINEDLIILNNGEFFEFDQIQKRRIPSQIEEFLSKKEMAPPSSTTNTAATNIGASPSTAQQNEAAAKKALDEKAEKFQKQKRKQQYPARNGASKQAASSKKTSSSQNKKKKTNKKSTSKNVKKSNKVIPKKELKKKDKPAIIPNRAIDPRTKTFSRSDLSFSISSPTADSVATADLYASTTIGEDKTTSVSAPQITQPHKNDTPLIHHPMDIQRLKIAKENIAQARKFFEFHKQQMLDNFNTSHDSLIAHALGLHLMCALGALYHMSTDEDLGQDDFEQHVAKFVIEIDFAANLRNQLRHSYEKHSATDVINFAQKLLDARMEERIDALLGAAVQMKELPICDVTLKSALLCQMEEKETEGEQGEAKDCSLDLIYRKINGELDKINDFKTKYSSSTLFDPAIYIAAQKKCFSNISECLNALSKMSQNNILESSLWLKKMRRLGNHCAHVDQKEQSTIQMKEIKLERFNQLIEKTEQMRKELETIITSTY